MTNDDREVCETGRVAGGPLDAVPWSTAPQLRVLITVDHTLLRHALVDVTMNASHDVVVAASAREAAATMRVGRFDVCVVALTNRADLIGGITEIASLAAAPVLCVADDADPGLMRQVLDAGATGFATRWTSPEEVCRLITIAATGELALDGRAASKMVASMRTGSQLSARELDVLRGVVAGKSNEEIAADMFVSRSTVAAHLQSIFTKLGVTCRVTAAVSGLRLGLIA